MIYFLEKKKLHPSKDLRFSEKNHLSIIFGTKVIDFDKIAKIVSDKTGFEIVNPAFYDYNIFNDKWEYDEFPSLFTMMSHGTIKNIFNKISKNVYCVYNGYFYMPGDSCSIAFTVKCSRYHISVTTFNRMINIFISGIDTNPALILFLDDVCDKTTVNKIADQIVEIISKIDKYIDCDMNSVSYDKKMSDLKNIVRTYKINKIKHNIK